MRVVAFALAAVVAAGCPSKPADRGAGTGTATGSGTGTGAAGVQTLGEISRADFNRFAVRLNLPVYWIGDADGDGALDPDEVTSLLFYPTTGVWVSGGAFTSALRTAYDQIATATRAAPPTGDAAEVTRRGLVAADLDYGRPTLVHTDARTWSPADQAFLARMLDVAAAIDALYDKQTGAAALAERLPADVESRSLFRRNRGPRCVSPGTETDPACSAIPGAPQPVVDVYPAALQARAGFCKELGKRPDAAKLLAPFVVVRGEDPTLVPEPYTVAYRTEMTAIADHLEAAAAAMNDPAERALVAYLRAAAGSFRSNDWFAADAAWAKMSVDNSRWYVRVGPDEVYWDPCVQKAGFHLTLARIDEGSKAWQGKLVPVQQEMEAAIAAASGAPYKPRKVTFKLPDFIAIVVNAGDDRDPVGATVGQSLPNWGPVAERGGRTIAMVNLYTDADSIAARRRLTDSLLDAASAKLVSDAPDSGLLATILHEAVHNLGPAQGYKVKGKTDDLVFGGPIAAVLEELKAQTGALYLIELLRGKAIIDDATARGTYADAIVWAFGQAAQGMYTPTKERKTYPQLAAIQIGFLIEQGALTWDANATAANGTDKGAFVIHPDKLVAASEAMMHLVGGIKARGDKAGAERLITAFVDGNAVPLATITERFLRNPRASFVYAVER